MIITFFNQRIAPLIPEYQKKVMDHFNVNIEQIIPQNWGTHAGEVDKYLKETKRDWEYMVLFDVDCIPLNKDIVNEGIEWSMNNLGLFSVAQYASHIPDSSIYASPAFLCFSRKTYESLDSPKFIQTHRSDCGGELTYEAMKRGYTIELMYPSHVETPKWKLGNKGMFGLGTTYDNKIYHHFEARQNRVEGFVKKCKDIIYEN